ncbi:competence protein ComK [Neobacillus niacini]|uniref:competence protein ComK n=1 Tax=Neobacillus niacini TaxID=86668 RepID=UPI002FFEA84A
MKIKYKYLINEKTILFYGVYYENGELYTFVVHDDDVFLVAMPPMKLIDKTLMSYGSSFKGAIKSSQLLLGKNRKMYPIKIDASLDIWIFPTKSYKKENCVWFALNHVIDTKPQGVQFTKVFLTHGHTIELAMKESAFREKRRNTDELKDKIVYNTKYSFRVDQPKIGFIIVEKKGKYLCKNYDKNKVEMKKDGEKQY